MNKTTIQCVATAPIFMAGGESKTNERGREEMIPELRAPSIKGVMRFVWRAIQAGGDTHGIREKEGELFGNAFGGKETRQSAMRLKIMNVRQAIGADCAVPHRELQEYKNEENENGVRINLDKNGRPKPAFLTASIRNGATFDVVITSFGDVGEHENFVRLFVVTSMLAGFGKRSRKGFGTVAVTKIDGVGENIRASFDGLCDDLNALSPTNVTYFKVSDKEIGVKPPMRGSYPYIERIFLAGRGNADTKRLSQEIGMAVHHHGNKPASRSDKPFLGSDRVAAAGGKRYASSVLLSTVKQGNNYRCIVTQLHYTGRTNVDALRNSFYNELNGRV